MAEDILKIEADSEGVWLSALSDDFTPAALINFLLLKGVRKYDEKAVNEFARQKKRTPQKIADRSPSEEKRSLVVVHLHNDDMSASVTVEPPFFTNPWPDKAGILESLARKNIVFGVDEAAIEELAQLKLPYEHVTVARGKQPKNGRDAHIEILLDPDKAPRVDYGAEKIDHKMRSAFVNVNQGEIIAVKHPAGKGEDGITVLGAACQAVPGKDISFPVTSGFNVSEDGLALTAAIDGRLLRRDDKKLAILPELEIKGDVDYGTGNIDFKGCVKILGAVRDGFRVLAGNDIEIKEVVEGARIVSSSGISVSGGILGMNKGYVIAAGDITANFADQAYIRSGGDIKIKNSVLHSDVGAHQTITVMGGQKSRIIGGKIQAGEAVLCNTLGNEMGTKTELIVGLIPEVSERRKELQGSIVTYKGKLEALESDLVYMKKKEQAGLMDEAQRSLMLAAVRSKYQHQAALKGLQDELEDIERRLGLMKPKGIVKVKGICYPGVAVTIRDFTYVVRESFKYGAFVYDEGKAEVRIQSFDALIG